MAYCATGSNWAIRQLLHFAVSDINDDVRRVALHFPGLYSPSKSKARTPHCPLLAESYNPHVRYGAALALGISCAGTGYLVSESTIGMSHFLILIRCIRKR